MAYSPDGYPVNNRFITVSRHSNMRCSVQSCSLGPQLAKNSECITETEVRTKVFVACKVSQFISLSEIACMIHFACYDQLCYGENSAVIMCAEECSDFTSTCCKFDAITI